MGLAGVPLVPAEPGTVAAPGVENVPDVVGDPGELDEPEVELLGELDELGMEPVAELDDPVPLVLPEVPLVAGVPDVPLDPGIFSAPGVRYVPEVVGEPGALAPLVPVEEVDLFSPVPIAPQAPSTKTHARGMIHLFIK